MKNIYKKLILKLPRFSTSLYNPKKSIYKFIKLLLHLLE